MNVKIRIVGIGNSIVNGFPLKRSQCFLSQIRNLTGFEVINKGVNGETTDDIVKRFNKDLIFHCPDLGIVLTGTNDFIHETSSPSEAVEKIGWMIKKMEEENIKPIILTPLLINVEQASKCWMAGAGINYEKVNQNLKKMSDLILANFPSYGLDLQNKFEIEMESRKEEQLFIDGLHPTAEGHKIIGEIITEYINSTI